jgi:hypothetical protein
MSCRVRGVAAALLLLSGAFAPAGAAPRQVGSPPIRSASRAAATQPSAVASFWRHLTNLWGKTGGSLDPFGNPTPGGQGTSGTTTDHADTGGSLDPFGVK